jgi:sec-independent protein translocase protein TatB
VFGISFTEMLVIAIVALVVVGPQKLPKMLRSAGEWMAKLRRITTEVRAQTGIDDILRAEGLSGGLNELRSIMNGPFGRGHIHPEEPAGPPAPYNPYSEVIEEDLTREYPPEGVDAASALPEDLLSEDPPSVPLDPAASAEDKPSPTV